MPCKIDTIDGIYFFGLMSQNRDVKTDQHMTMDSYYKTVLFAQIQKIEGINLMSTPEKAAEYLNRVNWKSLVEWLTAEAILHRPADPLQFTRDLIGAKLGERGGMEFNPEQVTDWLRNCYTEATALVDENGVIRNKSVAKTEQTASEQIEALRRKIDSMEKLLDASKSIANLDPLQATDNIIFETCRILNCDRATIFTLDKQRNELVLCVAEGARNIRVPVGKGIAGTVAATGETINIPDAYSDSRFDSSADRSTGYKTTTILCKPIRSADGGIVGVLQAINKKDGLFSIIDDDVMTTLATQAGVALQNANIFRNSEAAREKFRSLLDIIRAMQGEMGVNSLIFTITQRTTRVVEADRCTLFLVDSVSRSLFAMQGEVNIKIPMEKGIAGHVATTGEVCNIPDAYESQLFNQEIDKKTGYRTKAILCMPIKANDAVIGVIQMINKMDDVGVFSNDDEDILMIFLAIAGPIIAASNLYQSIQGKGDKESGAKGSKPEVPTAMAPLRKDGVAKKQMKGFAEGNEEDEDDEGKR